MLKIKSIGQVGHAYRTFRRYRQILRILLKFGFEDILQGIRAPRYIEYSMKRLRPKKGKVSDQPRPVRLRLAIEALGPTFIKLGQMLATRPDLLPHAYIEELAKLQDKVPAFAEDKSRKIIIEELGAPPEEIFKEFTPEPIAAASMAQVHRAVTFDDEKVVIKVQRPGIHRVIDIDLEIMMHLSEIAEAHVEELAILRPSAIISEFGRSLHKELDFKIEATNARRFREMVSDNRHVNAPRIYREYSTSKVLTMQEVQGLRCTEFLADIEKYKWQYDLPLMASRGVDAILDQIFVHGFYHADPHPGNIFLQENDSICFIDFGMMGKITVEERRYFARLLESVIQRDQERIVQGCLRFTTHLREPDLDVLTADITDLIDENLYLPIEELNLSEVLEKLLNILIRNYLRIKSDLYMLIKTVMTLERFGRDMDPHLKIIDHLEPFVKRLRRKTLSPVYLLHRFSGPAEDFLEVAGKIPLDAQSVLEQTRKGKLKVQLQINELIAVEDVLVKIGNRVSHALVLGSLVLGSSIVVHAKVPPLYKNISIIGIIGYLLSAVIGFKMLFIAYRQSRMTEKRVDKALPPDSTL